MDSAGETQEERQGKMLLHTEYSLLSLLHNQDGVVHHHGLFQVDQQLSYMSVAVCIVYHQSNGYHGPKNEVCLLVNGVLVSTVWASIMYNCNVINTPTLLWRSVCNFLFSSEYI